MSATVCGLLAAAVSPAATISSTDEAQLVRMAAEYLRTGRSREAVPPLREAWQANPQSLVLPSLLARALLASGDVNGANAILHKVIERNPDSVNDNLMLGIAEAELHGEAEARPFIEKAVGLNPRAALAWYLLGNLDLRAGAYLAAARNYRQATELAPENGDHAYGAALALERADQPAEAVSFAETAARLRPDRAATHYLLGKTYAKLGRAHDALVELQACLRLHPQADAAYYQLARIYLQLGDRESASVCSARFEELKRAADRHAGLMTPAAGDLRIDTAPEPWDRTR